MIIPISSIVALTFAVWLANKKLSFQICPICAGTTLTWVGILIGLYFGWLSPAEYQIPLATLAGGTVVGAMSKLESRIRPGHILCWKVIFALSGFWAVSSLVGGKFIFAFGAILLSALTTLFFQKPRFDPGTEREKEIREKMQSCC